MTGRPAGEGRVVLVTGAAGGLGRALVARFAQEGWRVAAAGHRTLPSESAKEVWASCLEVTDRAAVEAWVSEAVLRWGRVDALVNNAGTVADQILVRADPKSWERVVDVNLKGPFLCAQAVLPVMLRAGSGHIINIGSHSARGGTAGRTAYAASKAGLVGLTLALAREVGPPGVAVNVVVPGVMPTGMTAGLPAGALADLAGSNVLTRMPTAEEVADFVVALCGLRHVSGQVFRLDGRLASWA